MFRNAVIAVIVLSGIIYAFLYLNPFDDSSNTQRVQTNTVTEEIETLEVVEEFNKSMYSLTNLNSIWLVVNKENAIPASYVPSDLTAFDENGLLLREVAVNNLAKMFTAASRSGNPLRLGSAYRSFSLQKTIFENYAAANGEAEANKFSARPGQSEHQTGLAADVSGVDGACYLETCFGLHPAGIWIEKNAHRFGFIVRYPQGKQSITGYQYEPWHLRYVGKELATELYNSDQTVEEFFNL